MRVRSALFLLAIVVMVLTLGAYLPLKFLDMAREGAVEGWVAALLSVFAILSAGAVGFFGVIFAFALLEEERVPVTKTTGLTAYRARQRAMLEELDEAVKLLREIRDILKSAGE